MTESFKALSDNQLIDSAEKVVTTLRRVDVSLLEHLAEIEGRELHLRDGYSSLFKMCTEKFRLSEASAYRRVAAARLLRQFPSVKVQLLSGEVTMCTLALVAGKMNDLPNDTARLEILAAIGGKSKSQVEELLALRHISGAAKARDVIRPMRPAQKVQKSQQPLALPVSPTKKPTLETEEVAFRIAFTASSEFRQKLQKARDLLRHKLPDGNLETILNEALDHLLKAKNLRGKRTRTVTANPSNPRHIPAEVKRSVLDRDGERCTFTGADGHRCREMGALEFDHKIPFALGGSSIDSENIELLCRNHNGWRARQVFSKARNLSGKSRLG